ncbi:MAG TPA: zinc-ribbon domain-containing protein [Polyangiaceae bacterium]|nr:zinc-ribbon domain-containing protein [Polyangiaceae bacterium]
MKISCQSCQAKYTIADEKVLGKIVKIRCKKCGATIVINGNEQDAATSAYDPSAQAAPAAAGGGGGVYDYTAHSGGDPWTVNVSDGDQRSMTSGELVAAFQTGTVNEETYCWKDGMSDWLPLREIPELYAACTAGPQPTMNPDVSAYDPQQQPPPADDQPTQAGFSSLFGGAMGGQPQQPQNGGGALFGGGDAMAAPAAAAASAPAAARRAGGRGGGGADLFGSAAQAGSEQEVMTSASANPQPVADDKMTGSRNENSVLFSLAALTSSAPEKKQAPQTTEGSGLIDIRALSASMETKGDGGKKVDDIMNLSGGGAFSAALAAPVLAPAPADLGTGYELSERKKSNMPLVLGIIGGFVIVGLLASVGVYMALAKNGSSAVAAVTATAPTPTAPASDTAGAGGGAAGGGALAAADPGTGAKPPDVGQTSGGAKAPTGGGHASGGGGGAAHAGGGGGGGGGGAEAPPPATHGGGGCAPGDLACEMAKSAGQPPPSTGGGGGGGGGTAPFDKGAAAASLGGIASSVGSCKKDGGPTGSGHVKVTFQPSGSVSSVEVDSGPFPGTSVGGCVAGKFRGAHIPAFSGGAVTVGKSFVIN